MKYSIIFCYRDRPQHLSITIPRVKEVFKDKEHEIIVVEQDDNEKFRRANTLNEGAKLATGDILVLHDIDYYPVSVNYHDELHDVYLPVKRVEFVTNDLRHKPIETVPSGYRHFKDAVDNDFYGGVISFKKEAFFKCGGFTCLMKGWGFEDADLRERINFHGLTIARSSDNLFYALDHLDSAPPRSDQDLQNNIRLFGLWKNYLNYGAESQLCSKEIITPSPDTDVDLWVKVKNFDIITGRDRK